MSLHDNLYKNITNETQVFIPAITYLNYLYLLLLHYATDLEKLL